MYTIQKGDNLSSIAQRNGTTVNDLLQLNPGIKNPNMIYAGSQLNLTAPQSQAPVQPQPQVQAQPVQQPMQAPVQTPVQQPMQTSQAQPSYITQYEEQLAQIQQNQQQQDLWFEEQRRIQEGDINRNVEYQTGLINQQKERADQELTKEGIASQVDYMKSLNPYGVDREQQIQMGLGNTGYSESTRTQHYNTMQNRVSSAINTTSQIKADFDNKITEARLSGDRDKAQLALEEYNQKINSMWKRLELETGIKDRMEDTRRWEDEFAYQKQSNEESKMIEQQRWEEELRRYNEQMTLEQSKFEEEKRQFNESLSLSKAKSSGGGSSGGSSSSGSGISFSGEETSQISNQAKVLLNMFTERKGFTTAKPSQQQMIDGISNNYKNGKITESDVEYLLNAIGVN